MELKCLTLHCLLVAGHHGLRRAYPPTEQCTARPEAALSRGDGGSIGRGVSTYNLRKDTLADFSLPENQTDLKYMRRPLMALSWPTQSQSMATSRCLRGCGLAIPRQITSLSVQIDISTLRFPGMPYEKRCAQNRATWIRRTRC